MQYINSVFMALHAINSTAIKFWHNTAFLKANKRMDIKRTSRNKSFIIVFSLRWLHPETQPHKSRAEPEQGSEMRYFITVPLGMFCLKRQHLLWNWKVRRESLTYPVMKWQTRARCQKGGDLRSDRLLNTTALLLVESPATSAAMVRNTGN